MSICSVQSTSRSSDYGYANTPLRNYSSRFTELSKHETEDNCEILRNLFSTLDADSQQYIKEELRVTIQSSYPNLQERDVEEMLNAILNNPFLKDDSGFMMMGVAAREAISNHDGGGYGSELSTDDSIFANVPAVNQSWPEIPSDPDRESTGGSVDESQLPVRRKLSYSSDE